MNVLPTMDNLLTRVDVSSVCALCQIDTETSVRALLSYSFAESCWHLGKSRGSRNEFIWSKRQSSTVHVFNEARNSLYEWRNARQVLNQPAPHRQDVVTIKWKPPDVGHVKCNFDAVLNHSSRTAGYGAVIQNSDGQWVMGKATRLVRTSDPILAEALGFKEVLSWLKGLALSNVQVESDCLQVVNAIHGSLLDFSYFGLLINDGKALLQELVNVSITFIKQSANQSAHTTIRLALSLYDAVQWGSIPPLFLEDVLQFDLSNM
ncbi:hypothetical protein GH714_034875 [Hevea brasiliensis]|uniref:RNase H type-1 domain-containing protein n=1 Tax=Hevea brasiliensis TaxID=3981 RepID=A0A6A6MIZ6_HEVBR|nr:hypothetical protein GH714_034875 [Hevea brasiliensis]